MASYGVTHTFHALARTGAIAGIRSVLAALPPGYDASDIFNERDKHGLTVLHCAMEGGSVELAQLLIDGGADVDAGATHYDARGWTPLHFAAFYGNAPLIDLLVARGASIDTKDAMGNMTPLKVAVTKEHEDAAAVLIGLGADVKVLDHRNYSLLHDAALVGSIRIIEMLIEAGVPVDSVADDQSTPLCWAAREGNAKVAELLIAKGADVNFRGTHGESPMYAASMFGRTKMISLLKRHGAK